MLFYFPLALIIVLTVLYRNDLGIRTLAVYWLIWIGAFVLFSFIGFSPYFFVALQAMLAVAMLTHSKLRSY